MLKLLKSKKIDLIIINLARPIIIIIIKAFNFVIIKALRKNFCYYYYDYAFY